MSKRILIVDDVRDIAEAFRKQLDLAGYDVEVALGGREGLDMAAASMFDLIILDLVMPGLDGIEFLKLMAAEPGKYSGAPVIVSTNATAEDTRQKAFSLGAKAVVVKTDADIEEVLASFFEGK